MESSTISALILFLIVSPIKDFDGLIFIFFVSVAASISKFLLAPRKKHIFNPVAISLFVAPFIFDKFASWWVGVSPMLPFIAIGGFLIIKKLRRWDLILGFILAVFLTLKPANWILTAKDTTLIFFMTVMLTEPLTTPPTKILRIIYGAIAGFLFYKLSPETALVLGNIFSYIVSPKWRLALELKSKKQIGSGLYDFIFKTDQKINFTPGQYIEFTFGHSSPDFRGNRRYFSLANSPTEKEIRVGMKLGSPPSSFKRSLLNIKKHQKILAGQLMGDFVLPKNTKKKLVMVAGGIGITPFRSMLKYLIDINQERDLVVLYSVRKASEFVYKDILSDAKKKLGIKTIFVETAKDGRFTKEDLYSKIPDYQSRTFYISGSHGFVEGFKDILKSLGIPFYRIVTDYFPGL